MRNGASDFFDRICSMDSMKTVLQGLLCPCTLQYRNGKSIGLYQLPGKGSTDLCTDFVLSFAVFMFPLAIFAMLIGGYWVEGLYSLAAVVWVAFVVVGATHRMNVRDKYNLKGSFPKDVVSYACCYCLALRQEALQCEVTATI